MAGTSAQPQLVGEAVTIVTPENPRLDGTAATVRSVESWGCHLTAPAAATGQFRAAWHEMILPTLPMPKRPLRIDALLREAREQGYTGDMCPTCGSTHMVNAGACQLCMACQTSSGCS